MGFRMSIQEMFGSGKRPGTRPGPSVYTLASALRSLSSGALSSGQAIEDYIRDRNSSTLIGTPEMQAVIDKLEVYWIQRRQHQARFEGEYHLPLGSHARSIRAKDQTALYTPSDNQG